MSCDADGYFTFVGRADDVFKASDYRISPFELESALIEHPDIVECAIVPSPDPIRSAVPKAFVVLRSGVGPSREIALSIFQHVRQVLTPFPSDTANRIFRPTEDYFWKNSAGGTASRRGQKRKERHATAS